jgi:hypothetical protein
MDTYLRQSMLGAAPPGYAGVWGARSPYNSLGLVSPSPPGTNPLGSSTTGARGVLADSLNGLSALRHSVAGNRNSGGEVRMPWIFIKLD